MDAVDRIFQLAEVKYKEQRDFAASIGVTPSIVSEWKRRKSSSFSKPKHIERIAEVLGTSVQWLLTGEKVLQSNQPTPEAGDGLEHNILRMAGRDGSYIERKLTDEQIAALKTIISQLPDATDL